MYQRTLIRGASINLEGNKEREYRKGQAYDWGSIKDIDGSLTKFTLNRGKL